MTRLRIAAPVAVVYWAMLLSGLALYSAAQQDLWSSGPLWMGAVTGTLLGHGLALSGARLRVVIGLLGAALMLLLPVTPRELARTELWAAFVPATLCAAWSLSDRAALAAFWFPTVIWMLTVLDHTPAGRASVPGAVGVLLLGSLAALFVVFLCVRETRRVALWRTVSTAPLASTTAPTVLREAPGAAVARAAWALGVAALAFTLTAWLAPQLWSVEAFDGPAWQASGPWGEGDCCPGDGRDHRVAEYFDLGRATHRTPGGRGAGECRVCRDPFDEEPFEVAPGRAAHGSQPRAWHRGGAVAVDARGDDEHAMISPDARWTIGGGEIDDGHARPTTSGADLEILPDSDMAPPSAPPHPPRVAIAGQPSAPRPARASAPAHGAHPRGDVPPHAPGRDPGGDPSWAPDAPPGYREVGRDHASAGSPSAALGRGALRWLTLLAAAALSFQLVSIALRPLRRWITLRHLRRPLWPETLDQRVSNAWQLALIGLRDAGWRTGSSEAPREFAHRVGIDGLERCARVLERARHGVGLDAGDLDEMTTAADAVYRAARHELGVFARLAGWLRAPLA